MSTISTSLHHAACSLFCLYPSSYLHVGFHVLYFFVPLGASVSSINSDIDSSKMPIHISITSTRESERQSEDGGNCERDWRHAPIRYRTSHRDPGPSRRPRSHSPPSKYTDRRFDDTTHRRDGIFERSSRIVELPDSPRLRTLPSPPSDVHRRVSFSSRPRNDSSRHDYDYDRTLRPTRDQHSAPKSILRHASPTRRPTPLTKRNLRELSLEPVDKCRGYDNSDRIPPTPYDPRHQPRSPPHAYGSIDNVVRQAPRPTTQGPSYPDTSTSTYPSREVSRMTPGRPAGWYEDSRGNMRRLPEGYTGVGPRLGERGWR